MIVVGMHGLPSSLSHRWIPRVPTYDTERTRLGANCCSIVKFHCSRHGADLCRIAVC